MKEIKLGDLIGKGAYGSVYKGEWLDPRSNEWIDNVAIKVIDLDAISIRSKKSIEDVIQNQIKETQLIQKINSLYVVRVYSEILDRENKKLYIIMNLMPANGLTIKLEIEEFKKNNDWKGVYTTIINVLKQLVYALLDINNAGIIHRDIKPENILYDPDTKRVQIADFGLSCIKEECTGISGTLNDLEPNCISFKHERRSFNCRLNELSDIFSTGMTIAVLLVGRPVSKHIQSNFGEYMKDYIIFLKELDDIAEKYKLENVVTTIIKPMIALDQNKRFNYKLLEILSKKLKFRYKDEL